MTTTLRTILGNRYGAIWATVFAVIIIAAPERGPTAGVLGRVFMAFWCASGLALAALHLFNTRAARIVLNGLFALKNQLSLFGRERDAYAMSDLSVRAVGLGLLVITSLGFYDIFFR